MSNLIDIMDRLSWFLDRWQLAHDMRSAPAVTREERREHRLLLNDIQEHCHKAINLILNDPEIGDAARNVLKGSGIQWPPSFRTGIWPKGTPTSQQEDRP